MGNTLIDLITNIVLLMSLSVIYSIFDSESRLTDRNRKMIMGISVSIVGFIVMSNSVEVSPGIMFDGRSILMLLSGMFFGLIPVIIGGVSLSLYRVYLGGGGVIPGMLWVILPGIIGMVWRHYRLKQKHVDITKISVLEQYLVIFITQVLMVGILFLFPGRVPVDAINQVAIPLSVFYPIGGLLVSMFMLKQRKNYFRSVEIKDREREYSDLFHKSSSYSMLVDPKTNRIMNVNQAAIMKYGYTYDEFVNMKIYDLSIASPEVIKKSQDEAESDNHYVRTQHILKNKDILDVEIRTTMVIISGVEYSYATITDITTRLLEEQKYQDVNVKLKATLHSVTEGVISTNEHGDIEIINDIAKGYISSKKKLTGKSMLNHVRIYSKDKEIDFEKIFSKVMTSNEPFLSKKPFMLIKEDDSVLYINFSLSPITYEDGSVKGSILVFRDVTSDFEKSNRIEYVSQHDFLTGLYNRYFLEVEMRRLNTKRQLPISIIHGDVNGLKLTNDAFGHIEGDNLLKEVALIFKKATRSEDITARWGGDEFIILLPQTTKENAEKVRQRIVDLQNKSMYDIMTPSVSLGIATKTKEDEDLDKVLAEAELEMYSNKQVDGKVMRTEFLNKLEKRLYHIHPELGSHASTVGMLAKEFGEYLNLKDEELSNLIKLAIYHDIGWIGIEEKLLLKTGKLTKKETEKIRSHPEVGFRIMKSIPELTNIADLIFSHHEKWDGTGYPEGIKGKDIPFLDRVLIIVDAYDMMINNSIYSPIKTQEEAVKDLENNAGKQFDPELVKKFIEMLNEKRKQ